MSNFLQTLMEDRKKFLDGLDANKGDISLEIFEDFYPDQAHFVFELLQNAEDARADEAIFTLTDNGCWFEHNGKRPFTESDVRAITGIHNSTKTKASDQIGKFGVGFKSVFVYTQTPTIYSADFSFSITRLVMPEPVESDPSIGEKTKFWLPFDKPKKREQAAFSEIRNALRELAGTALLFLSNIESIKWRVKDELSDEIRRIKHSEHHFEVLKQSSGGTITNSHFLRFDQPVPGLEKQRVSIAFALDLLPKAEQFDGKKSLAKQFKVTPASPGQVAVYFPAQKETSGLRFHLHGPFVPELSRASIKETPANHPLFQQIAELAVTSLHQIRDLGLLTADFLAVLPNPHDELPDRYRGIRQSIIEAMKTQPLTPTQAKTHAPARQLLQAKKPLKDLLSEDDLRVLVENENSPFQWAIGATQSNSDTDRFLSGLKIRRWDAEQLVDLLWRKTTKKGFVQDLGCYSSGPDTETMSWLSGKTPEWHQRLYAFLYEEFSRPVDRHKLKKLKNRCVVRQRSGEHGIGGDCFFPNEGIEQDDIFPRVDAAVYTSGKDRERQDQARKFLEEIGVREVGEAEQIEAVLKQRYDGKKFDPRKKELGRFIALVEKEPIKAELFRPYFIFEGTDGKWHKPSSIFLDKPFKDTGLSVYYDAVKQAKRYALANWYQNYNIPVERIAKFAEAVGAQVQLVPKEVSCQDNPEWSYLRSVGGERERSPIDKDYIILGLEDLLAKSSIDISRLLWSMLRSLREDCLKATYRKNLSYGPHYADSQLVHHLRKAAWIPQKNGRFVRPAEADSTQLPEDFDFASGWSWLKAIHFNLDAQQEKQAWAEKSGFRDAENLERALRFSALPKNEQERILSEREHKQNVQLPEREPSNPERRDQQVRAQAKGAPERKFERKIQSEAVGRDPVKEQAAEYLRDQYTNDDKEMICQVCQTVLPFKLDNGRYYFEKVEFLEGFKRWHHQNYLALCPNHAAMFQHANGSREEIKESFQTLHNNRLEIVLAQENASIYFTTTHITDLRALIASESEQSEMEEFSG